MCPYSHCSYAREPECDHAEGRTDHHPPTLCIRTPLRPWTSPAGPDTLAEAPPEEAYIAAETAPVPFRSASYWQTGWSGGDTARARALARVLPRALARAAQAPRGEESLHGWMQEERARMGSVVAAGGVMSRSLQAAEPESTTLAVD